MSGDRWRGEVECQQGVLLLPFVKLSGALGILMLSLSSVLVGYFGVKPFLFKNVLWLKSEVHCYWKGILEDVFMSSAFCQVGTMPNQHRRSFFSTSYMFT